MKVKTCFFFFEGDGARREGEMTVIKDTVIVPEAWVFSLFLRTIAV